MCREGYGDPDYYVCDGKERIYCGWNIHHILPKTCGGTNAISNLICTNIATNDESADKITFWIDGDYCFDMGGNMMMDSDGNLMQDIGGGVAMDMESGEMHIVESNSSFGSSFEDED